MIQRTRRLYEQLPHGTRVRLITDGTVPIANEFLAKDVDGVIMQRDDQEGRSFMVFDEPFEREARGWSPIGATFVAPHQVEVIEIH